MVLFTHLLRVTLLATALVILTCPGRAFADAPVLRTAAQESYPKYYKDESGLMRGICAEIARSICTRAGVKLAGMDEFLPFKRLQVLLEFGELDVFFGFAISSSRMEKYRFSEHPLYWLNYTVMTRADDAAARAVTSLAEIRALGETGRVLTPFGSRTNNWLEKRGGFVLDTTAKKLSECVQMLLAGRGRFVFYHQMGLIGTARRMGVSDDVRVLPLSFEGYGHYVAFGKHVDPAVIEAVERAMLELEADGSLDAIRARYLSPGTEQ